MLTTIHGSSGYDILGPYGTYSPMAVYGHSGNDWIEGGHGDDALYGNQGNDEISGARGVGSPAAGNYQFLEIGRDTLYGGQDDDFLVGGSDDVLYGNKGDDTLMSAGLLRSDVQEVSLYGGKGTDVLVGGNNDSLYGNKGTDLLFASGRGSTLDGGSDADWVCSLGPKNTLVGGTGNDLLTFRDLTLEDVYMLARVRNGDLTASQAKALLSKGPILDYEGEAWGGPGADIFLVGNAAQAKDYNPAEGDILLVVG